MIVWVKRMRLLATVLLLYKAMGVFWPVSLNMLMRKRY